MNTARWERTKEVFEEALKLDLESRREYLDAACGKDQELRVEVDSLIASYEQAGTDFLDRAAAELLDLTSGPDAPPQLRPGQLAGPYRLIREIGRGGMGQVWLAERCDGRFDRRVAIKFIQGTTLAGSTAQRFKREGSFLSKLAHPQIAELIDAGLTSTREPFLVLEYVAGQPIDEYCDQHKLDIASRIQLFLDVLSAVAHAHANLIVHRDIKPSNVLVRNDGQVKLLDFGIAKLLTDETGAPASATMLTAEAGSVLTPRFAAPEQIAQGTITTATDIYGLGVLLYLLSSGRHPAGAGPHSPVQLMRAILEEEPPRASVAALSVDMEAAAQRSSTPDRLSRQLRGDLDTILNKALKKDPAERYASVSAFADDLRRCLKHEPISARPDTISYRARKFVRRNRLLVSAAALTAAVILAISGFAIYQEQLAQRRFQDVRKLAHTFVFELYDQIAKLEGSTKTRELMARTGIEYLDNLSRNAGRDLQLQREIAAAYMKIGDAQGYPTKPNLGHPADALASYQKAGDILRKISAKDPVYLPALARFYMQYAGLVRFTRDLKRARQLSESAIQTFDRARASQNFGPMAVDYIQAWCTLGDIDEDSDRYRQAWAEFSKCRDLARAQLSETKNNKFLPTLSLADERVGTAAQELGHLLEALRALDEDESVLSQLLAVDPRHPQLHRMQALLYSYRSAVYSAELAPSFGDTARALESARQYLKFAESMAEQDPSNKSAQFSRAIATYAVSFFLGESDAKSAIQLAIRCACSTS